MICEGKTDCLNPATYRWIITVNSIRVSGIYCLECMWSLIIEDTVDGPVFDIPCIATLKERCEIVHTITQHVRKSVWSDSVEPTKIQHYLGQGQLLRFLYEIDEIMDPRNKIYKE